jgi:2-aminoadipate transaminase
MLPSVQLDPASERPLYRQLFEQIRDFIQNGSLPKGERLPATRELAGLLGLNRTTVAAAYELLESEGLIKGHVGRGSFVDTAPAPRIRWEDLGVVSSPVAPSALNEDGVSFATSRPASELFPIDEFRAACEEVIGGPHAQTILQLGSPLGYGPLRNHLLTEARNCGVARASDDIIITSGCQQALDLIQRALAPAGDLVALEDPVYPGLKNVFDRAGARLIGVPVDDSYGMDPAALERTLAREKPRLLVVASNFQNPTGATLPLASRRAILKLARAAGSVVVENDLYGELRYRGKAIPTLKELDETGDVILLGSFSKIAFPGLRVGWVIGTAQFIARLAEVKQWSDLHTDQLSQAVLLRFAESGRLANHRTRVLAAGAECLDAVLEACERHLPVGATFTRPEGGMNLWVRLPEPLDSGELLARAERANVNYLPGKYFAVSREHSASLRLSFAGLSPDRIRTGVARLGEVFGAELERVRARRSGPVPAMV